MWFSSIQSRPKLYYSRLVFLLRGCKEEEEGKIISFSKAEQKRDSDTVATNPTWVMFHELKSRLSRSLSELFHALSPVRKMLPSSITLFEKSNFCPKIQFWQNPNLFTSFSLKFFLHFFSLNQRSQQLKSAKPQSLREVFNIKKVENFLGKSSWSFGQKMKISNSVSIVIAIDILTGATRLCCRWGPHKV